MRTFLKIVVGAWCAVCINSTFAQTKGQQIDLGKREFEANCASCHGISGKGDGPMREFLTRPPADLTILSRNNAGVFPTQRLYEVIDGRRVPSHGREMPVWGREYKVKDAPMADEPWDAEMYVRTRIMALLDYLSRLQSK